MRKLDEITVEWNESLNNNIAKIESYFGEENMRKFYDLSNPQTKTICSEFRKIDQLLTDYRRNQNPDNKEKSLEDIVNIINDTNALIEQMNKDMLSEIRKLENELKT